MVNNEKNTVPKIISFLFPIVGILIYAINIGGNNKKLANDCLKYSIISTLMVLIVIIIIIFIPIIYNLKEGTYENQIRNNTVIDKEEIKPTKAEEYIILNSAEAFYNDMQDFYNFDKKKTISVEELISSKYLSDEYNYLSNYNVVISSKNNHKTFSLVKTNQ